MRLEGKSQVPPSRVGEGNRQILSENINEIRVKEHFIPCQQPESQLTNQQLYELV